MPALHICFSVVKHNSEFLSVRKIERYIHIYVFKLILNKTTAFPLLPLYSVLLFCSDLSSVGFFSRKSKVNSKSTLYEQTADLKKCRKLSGETVFSFAKYNHTLLQSQDETLTYNQLSTNKNYLRV